MGHPAAAVERRTVVARPRLRIVPVSSRRSPGSSAVRRDQRCRELFNLACLAMLAITIFALARVTLAANAAALAIEAGTINREIKAARLTGDLLECDKSALTTPSRIECIAGESLQMAEAPQVSYLTLPGASTKAETAAPEEGDPVATAGAPQDGEVVAVETAGQPGRLSGMLASLMEMATGEAEVLLVGDAGLASAR